MGFRPAGPPPRERPPGLGRRLLGGPDSWRRVVLTGLGGGLAVAAVAAFAVSFIDRSGGAIEAPPTPVAPVAAPVEGDIAEDVPEDVPVEEDVPPPVEEAPVEQLPVEEPPTEEPPTEALPTEPAPTPVIEEPTAAPTVAEPSPAE